MRLSLPLPFLVAALFLSGCQPGSEQPVPPAEEGLNYSETYHSPQFADRERIGNMSLALQHAESIYAESKNEHHLPGISFGVVVDDSLVFSGGVGTLNSSGDPVQAGSLFRIASMSKSFTAMAILKLRDEGALSLSDPASRYLPEMAKLKYLSRDATPVTLYNLLTMTAGFPEDNPWGDRFLDIPRDSLMALVKQGVPFSSIPSLNYEYSNLGYGLLGQIIARVTGSSFQEYISRSILKPLGMNNSIWEYELAPPDKLAQGYRPDGEEWVEEAMLHDGAFGSMGGLISSIDDFSKYISFHLSAWPPRNTPDDGPVRRSTLREMHQMFNPRFYYRKDRFGDPLAPLMRGYGYGLVSMKDQQGIVEIGHNGGLPGFGSNYLFYPQYGIGVVAFSNLTYVGGDLQACNYQVIKSLMDKGLFVPRELPVSPVLKLRQEQLAELLQTWDPRLEGEILAANFYMDRSRKSRQTEAGKLLDSIGKIRSLGPVKPVNQLRGSFTILGEKGELEVYFTLSPETIPRVQWLSFQSF